MQVKIIDWGSRISSICIPDKQGNLIETILGYKNEEDYLQDDQYFGCTVGRYANRIENGLFELDGQQIALSINETALNNHLHGGYEGLDKRFWTLVEQTESTIEMSTTCEDGEDGYPGNLTIHVKYEVQDSNSLKITYKAQCDRPTILNLTNHCYFNLSDERIAIDGHQITVNANYFCPLNDHHIPIAPYKKNVLDSTYDLRKPTAVEEVKEAICNCYYFNDHFENKQPIAILVEKKTSRKLEVFSNYPGVQIYFGNFLSKEFKPFQGLCCEPQFAPNSPNLKNFPSVVINADQCYQYSIEYKYDNF